MTNLSRSLREKLEAQYVIRKVDMLERQISKKDPTEKFLFELEDGNVVESVLMKYNMAIQFAFHHRSDVGWDASSVPRRLVERYEI